MSHNYLNSRNIRIFISSTFKDLQDERDYLIRRTFPKLRHIASERAVILTEIDLRWGISEEEAKSGKTVEICLNEIDNSIPFFIGLIGDRYGWIPTEDELAFNSEDKRNIVTGYLQNGLSVTEIEMQYGALKMNRNMHASFYIRRQNNGAYVDEPRKLNSLISSIRENGKYPVYEYNSTEELASLIEQEYIKLLDKAFPIQQYDENEVIMSRQNNFCETLLNNYVPVEENNAILFDWLENNTSSLMMIGGPGSGKSSCLAYWSRNKSYFENYNVIPVFINKITGMFSPQVICQFLCVQIRKLYGIKVSGFDSPEKELVFLIDTISGQKLRPLLIIMDGLDNLCDTETNSPKSLKWLPPFNNYFRVIGSSCHNDIVVPKFLKRGGKQRDMSFPSVKERLNICHSYLQTYGKKLSEEQLSRLIENSVFCNPSLLKVVLNDLIYFSNYSNIGDRIREFCQSSEESVFNRFIDDYEKEYKGVVTSIFYLLSVCNYGIIESDIIQLCSVTRLELSQICYSLSDFISSNDGLIQFTNPILKKSVRNVFGITNNDLFDVNEDTGFRVHYFMGKEELKIRESIIELYKKHLADTARIDPRLLNEIIFQQYLIGDELEIMDFIRPIQISSKLIDNNIDALYRIWHWLYYECDLSFDEYIVDKIFSEDDIVDLMKIAEFAYSYFDEKVFAINVSNICINIRNENNCESSVNKEQIESLLKKYQSTISQ